MSVFVVSVSAADDTGSDERLFKRNLYEEDERQQLASKYMFNTQMREIGNLSSFTVNE